MTKTKLIALVNIKNIACDVVKNQSNENILRLQAALDYFRHVDDVEAKLTSIMESFGNKHDIQSN